MLEEIKSELGAYYSDEDSKVLENIIDEVSANALSLSNQETTDDLVLEIKQCVKSIYLRRGTEHDKSLNANGESIYDKYAKFAVYLLEKRKQTHKLFFISYFL